MRSIVNDTKASIQFLSRLPFRFNDSKALPDFSRSAYAFPIAGLFIAIPAAVVLWIASYFGLSAPVTAIVAVAIMLLTTGALHEDGLADVSDGFWGGHTKERKLEIMRDSAIGTYGVLALILALILKIVILSEIIEGSGGTVAALLFLAVASLSRCAILQPWIALTPARNVASKGAKKDKNGKDTAGLSHRYGQPELSTAVRAFLLALPAIAIILYATSAWGMIVSLVLMQVSIIAMSWLSKLHIGGHTGDTLGATQQLSELGLFLGLVWTM